MTDWVDKIATWTIWIGMTIYMLWVFAKMFGLINTPQIILMTPYAVGGLVLISYFVKAGRHLEKFDNLIKQVERNTDSVTSIDKRLFRLETKL